MMAATVSRADVRFLIARVQWPVPAVKWWAIQELAGLLTDSLYRSEVEAGLYRALNLSKLETEVVEFLFVLWLAKQRGYAPSAGSSTYIRAQSPASSLILADIFNPVLHEGTFRSPLFEAPRNFEAQSDFREAQGTSVPRIYLHLLEKLESRQRFPFVKQFAFEWAGTASLYLDAPLQNDIRYFYGYPFDQMRGQFVTRATHRGMSAYLRTLSVANDVWGMPNAMVDEHALMALPLDPTLAALRPMRPPWLPTWNESTRPEPSTIDGFLSEVTKQLKAVSADAVLLTLSIPLQVSLSEILELEVVRWAQWEAKPVDARDLLDRANERCQAKGFGWCDSEGLAKTMHCPVSSLNDILDLDVDAAPTAGEPTARRRGYLHSDLYSRGILLPLSTVESAAVTVTPNGHELEVFAGKSTLGRWNFWNTGWDASHPRLTKAFCATSLVADKMCLHRLWARRPIRYFLLWRCARVFRDQSHSAYSRNEFVGVRFDSD